MNVMKRAHELTVRRHNAKLLNGINPAPYKVLFAIALKDAHREYKAMNDKNAVALLKADTIAKFEQRIIELNEAGAQYGYKWMVVCGDEHPMPVNMHAENPKWPWCKVEDATFWSHEKWAALEAEKVRNGNGQFGKAVLVDDHIKWDIAQLQKLIAAIKAE